MKKIVSHLPPRHLDDFLAISVLKNLFFDVAIEYINPQKVPKEYLQDKEIAVVDLGEMHSSELNNFDHHQDINLPCALALVLRKFYRIKVLNSPILNIIDKIDRFGFYRARKILKEYGIEIKTDENIEFKRRVILFTDLLRYGHFVGRFFVENIQMKEYEAFINNLYLYLDSLSVLDEPKLIVKKEDEEFYKKIENLKVYEIQGLKIAVIKDFLSSNVNEIFNKTNADILVERNGMDKNQTILLKNNKSPNNDEIDLSRIFKKYKKIFLHATGFLAVIDVPVENFNIEELKIVMENNA